VGRPGRWMVAALVTMAAFAVITWVSGVLLFMRLLPSPDARWPVAVTIGAAAAAFAGLWGQSWAVQSSSPDSRSVPVGQLVPRERREQEARDRLRQFLGRRDWLPRMGQISALALRVHPAMGFPQPAEAAMSLRAGTGSLGRQRRLLLPRVRPGRSSGVQALDPDLPAFVERDRGPQISSWMRRAREDGGFLVLVGDSSVGKTRLLYETAREVLPDFAVLAPDLGDSDLVNSIAAGAWPQKGLIVWLDELQRFLDGPYRTPGSAPITAAAVRHLLDAPAPVVMLGTMWPEHARQLLATEPDPHVPGQRLRYPAAADILGDRRVRQETLTSFSGTEREAAGTLSTADPRLAKALADRDYNVTEVLAGAPQLVARYEQAPEEQRAVLNAAVDARRVGIQAPLAGTLLSAAARGYLSTLHPDDTWFPPALAELTRHDRPHDHSTAPLIPVLSEKKDEVAGYAVADYLLQHLGRQRRSSLLPAATWQALIDHTRGHDDLVRLAVLADRRLLYRYAEPLYQGLADTGDTYAAHRLADMLANRNGPAEQITAAFQVLIDAGREYDANLWLDGATYRSIIKRLGERGREDVAATVLRAWADRGNEAAAGDWAQTLVKQNRTDQADSISRAAVDAGQAEVVESWFKQLMAQDNVDHAMAVLRAFAAAGGVRKAAHSDSLDPWLARNCCIRTGRSASRHPGGPSGGRTYVIEGWFKRLAQQGRTDDAMTILRVITDAGGYDSARALADLLADQGNIGELQTRADDEIERARRARPGEWVSEWFRTRLADLLAEQGNIDELQARADDETERQRRAPQGMWAGDWFRTRLADTLASRGDLGELRARAGDGDPYAASRLARLLADRGDLDGLRAIADAGSGAAASRLAELLADRGDLAGAVQILRGPADAGDPWWAPAERADLMARQGDIDGLRALADVGDEAAKRRLARLLADRGEFDEAAQILRALADAGNKDAAAERAWLLIEQNRISEAIQIAAALAEDQGESVASIASDWCHRLAQQGRTSKELTVLRAMTDVGDSWAADQLTGKLIALNRTAEALEVLRSWDDAGQRGAPQQIIGHIGKLIALNCTEEALDVLRTRADDGRGDFTYRRELAELLAHHDHLDELRARAGNGDEAADRGLADTLADRGDLDELRARAAAGSENAAWRLGWLGYLDQLRALADAGHDGAAFELAHLLADRGDRGELRDRADAGDSRAAKALSRLLWDEGRLEELRDEVDAGTYGAGAEFIDLLGAVGYEEQAEQIRSFGLNPDGSIPGSDSADQADHRT
jgi:hypothetical protein